MSIPIGGDNAFFLELYSRYRKDRNSVPVDWLLHFEQLDRGGEPGPRADAPGIAEALLEGYRRHGHLEAWVDPLAASGPLNPRLERLRAAAAQFGDKQVELTVGGVARRMAVSEAETLARSIYAGSAGLEVDHLESEEQRTWWYDAFERSFSAQADDTLLFDSLESIILADEFESFMRLKFPTKKRFGIEGGETAIVFLREVLRFAPDAGVSSIVMGGMHRGRLATLAVALGKNPATLAAELMGRDLSEGASFTGDVPYHLGYTSETDIEGKPLAVTLLPHPSHLLVVAPVALGLARAAGRGPQASPDSTLCLLLHTDAAFAGQGLAAELMQLGGLEGYSAAGAIHLVVNNQIGFTTLPSEGRSARYCTDVGKMVGAPILHVNGDDPVAVARVARLAVAWRRQFGKDVLIDLVCYRRHGHNELDEPRFTQPNMWKRIDGRPTVRERFSRTVLADREDLAERAATVAGAFRKRLQDGFEFAGDIAPNDEPVQQEAWNNLSSASEKDVLEPVITGVEVRQLREIGLAASTIPPEIDAHPKVRHFYEARAAALQSGEGINFATAEALAFASLLAEGRRLRLSGQDAVRGTFTQRHLAVHDVSSGEIYVPLVRAASANHVFEAVNSPLSEYGVLGFEYGHSLHDPGQLTMWEAQFGDFINGAQVVVDQYVVSAEAKWRLKSGLVLLLPHGLEGQGPDHSSARIERLTQLCAGGNIIVANPSTPANLFHLLRRQVHAPWRKPLFLIAPKSLLRAKAAVSALADMGEGTMFKSVIAEESTDPSRVRLVVLCSGKIFYALDLQRREAGLEDTVLPIRIEQLYPFPHAALKQALAPFRHAECVWLQEEPENQGAWRHVQAELAACGIRLFDTMPVVARPSMPVCAGGSIERHEREEKEILSRVLGLASPARDRVSRTRTHLFTS
jgi:2-oxoglutarate dehydrogenase E1 component